MTILLTTLNARYAHASLGLRYLLANMGDLQAQTALVEFVIGLKPADVVERLLARQPRIIGFGVYIWNVEETSKIVALLKLVAPQVIVVLGGPEVSHETGQQPICADADHVITGWGDVSFAALCRRLLAGETVAQKIVPGIQPPLNQIALPYAAYTDEDIAQRTLYVEASRGCPFKCEFCLSAIDKTAWAFDLDAFLAAMEQLYQRGARNFKFVDRTFNLKPAASVRLLEFFLDKLRHFPEAPLFVHFEVIPDHLPEVLRERIARFPPGVLQLEVGIQSFNPEVQALISRDQDNAQSEVNLRWLREASQAHLHTDLIIGLPGEDVTSIAAGFDRLIALRPHEIQVGLLKRLRGTPLIRHTAHFGLRFDPHPPYTILATDRIDFATMQRLVRFARYWDLVGNSGRFSERLPQMLGLSPFANFLAFADWLYAQTDATYRFSPERLTGLIDAWLDKVPTKVGADEPTKQQGGRAKDALFAVANGGTAKHTVAARQARHRQPSTRD